MRKAEVPRSEAGLDSGAPCAARTCPTFRRGVGGGPTSNRPARRDPEPCPAGWVVASRDSAPTDVACGGSARIGVACNRSPWTGVACNRSAWTGVACNRSAWTGVPCSRSAWTGVAFSPSAGKVSRSPADWTVATCCPSGWIDGPWVGSVCRVIMGRSVADPASCAIAGSAPPTSASRVTLRRQHADGKLR